MRQGVITRVAQDDYDDGIQEIVVFMEIDGEEVRVSQKWEWPDLKFRSDKGTEYRPTIDVYYALCKTMTPDQDYEFITRMAKLVEGEPITLAK